MLNINDDNLISQKIKYKGISIPLYPREYIPSEELPIGYSKTISNYINVERGQMNNITLNNKDKKFYNLRWELLVTQDKFIEFISLYNDYINDFNIDIDNSINIYLPNINISDSLKLEDNRIIDYYTNTYNTYNIIITSISEITEFFFKEKLVKFRMDGETI